MKKQYMRPEITIVAVGTTQMIAASQDGWGDSKEHGGELWEDDEEYDDPSPWTTIGEYDEE